MSKVHYLIGRTSTQAVSDDQAVLALLPETTRPAAVPTYSRQLYVGAKVLLRLGSGTNIFTAHFLPYMGAVDDNTLGENKNRLELLQAKIDDFSGDAAKRAKVFATYLSANHLIDRTLYPVVAFSGPNRPPIPDQTGHPIRRKPARVAGQISQRGFVGLG